jgi:hypothetical protein
MNFILFLSYYKTISCAIFNSQGGLTWREYVPNSNPSLHTALNQIFSLIPEKIPDQFKQYPQDFSRDRCLTFAQLVTFILSAATTDKNNGLNIKIEQFAKQARRSGLLPDIKPVKAPALSKARAKVPWEVFQNIFTNTVDLAYLLWEAQPWHFWHTMSVYAIDGSKYTLPASELIRQEFDPESGFDHPGKGHFPQCLVSTAYDVFKRLPVARCITAVDSSERDEAEKLLPHIPGGGVVLFDRGYPSYEFFLTLLATYSGYFLLRCPGESSFPAVKKFIQSKKQEDFIWIQPSQSYLLRCTQSEKAQAKPMLLRVIRLESPDGTISVLLTNIADTNQFPSHDIVDLYFQRYRIEEHYRDEKITLQIENFHTKSPNGIRQELFAAAIVSTIARILMNLSNASSEQGHVQPQFKNAIMSFAYDAFVLIPDEPEKAILIFKELLEQIARVKYYQRAHKRDSQPRICKKPPNKWCINRAKLLSKNETVVSCKP